MTDNEIIKALELCIRGDEGDCLLCPLHDVGPCTYEIEVLALDLINRQKAEIERYKKYYETMEIEIYSFRKDQAEVKFLKNKIRAEAIKDFAERLKEKGCRGMGDGGVGFIIHKDIDNLVKEMIGEQNNV
jgi:hypothetical protein